LSQKASEIELTLQSSELDAAIWVSQENLRKILIEKNVEDNTLIDGLLI
jgi:hypothetical protein